MNGSPSAIITLGLGSWGSPGLVVTLGYGVREAGAAVGSHCMQAAQVYHPGARMGEAFTPCDEAGEAYSAGARTGQVNC